MTEPEPQNATTPDDDEALEGELVDASADAATALAWSGDDSHALVPLDRSDPIEAFLRRIKAYPALADDDERALGRAARDEGDSDAARRLVVHNLRLVVTIAYEFRRAWNNLQDLIQEGSVGLVEAARRWDPDRGARFGTYAGYWVRAYLLRFILTNFRLVHAGNTRAGRKLFFQLERERQRLRALGVEPTADTVAHALGVDAQDVREVGATLDAPELPFDAPAHDDAGALSESLDSGAASPEALAAHLEVDALVRDLSSQFAKTLTDPRDRAIWEEHLLADEPLSLGDLGQRFGVSKQRMGQLANTLRARFRDLLAARLGPGVDPIGS